MPLVSVIMPAYNAGDYISDAILSILEQSFQDFELLVIDDGSTDNTARVIAAISDPRLRVIRHDANRGLIYGLNEGIALSTGKFIARMDADDISEPSRLESQIMYLKKNPHIGVVGSAIRLIDRNGKPGKVYCFPESNTLIEWSMSFFCPIAHPSVMVRASLLKGIGYSIEARHAEDYDLWARLMPFALYSNLQEPLLRLRKHAGNITITEKWTHLETSVRVAKSQIERVLSKDADIDAVRCLYSSGRTKQDEAYKACELVKALLTTQLGRNLDVNTLKLIQRDAAMRIIIIGIRGSSFINRIKSIIYAHKIYPAVLLCLILRLLSRFSGVGKQRLIG